MNFHLLYVFPEPLPLPGKARAIQVVKTVAALGALGVQVTLAYVQDRRQGEHPFAAYGMDFPANVRLLPLSRHIPGLPFKAGGAFVWRLRRWLAAQMRAGGAPDVVFVRHVKFAWRWLRAGMRVPLVYEAHEVFADTAPVAKQAQMREMEQAVLSQAAQVLAITGQLGKLLQARYGLSREIPVLPSATDLPVAAPEKDWSALPRSIVYAGSLYGWKGVDDLVDAAAYLSVHVVITIIGGDATEIARLQARQSTAGAQLRYLGHLPHPQVMAHLAEACLAVLPNRAESVSAFTSPLKLFEYMASGCALVVSDLPVFREVLGECDVAWFAAGDAVALAGAIQCCLEDVVFCQEAAGRLREQAKGYTWEARAQRLVACCQDFGGSRDE